jgi:hypothetical protein
MGKAGLNAHRTRREVARVFFTSASSLLAVMVVAGLLLGAKLLGRRGASEPQDWF